jgi:hypothetical protein
MTEQITDPQVLSSLLAEDKVEGFTVKPWTIKQLLQVMPILNGLAEKLKAWALPWTTSATWWKPRGWRGLPGLADLILPHLPEFLAASLRISREEAEDLDVGLALPWRSRSWP